MHVIEMGGRVNDLSARDDDVCGEGADGRVIPTSQKTKPSSVVGVREGGAMAKSELQRSLRAFRSKWVALPSARWNKEDALAQ